EHRRGRGAHTGSPRRYPGRHRRRVRVPLFGRRGLHHRPDDQRERRLVPVSGDADGPRLAPVARDDWNDDVVAALRRAFPDHVVQRFLSAPADAPTLPAAIATMMHHPALAGPWLAYNNVLLWSPALDHRLRELMVLRVAWTTRSEYEWVQHVKLGERYG